jgi:hypothetical protein
MRWIAGGQFGDGSLFLARFDPTGTLVWQRTWGENGSIGNGVAASPNGTIAVAGFVHAPPYDFDSVSNSSRNADATSTDVISTAPNPAGSVNSDPGGVVTTPIGSETYAGESFFLRLRR